MKPRDISLGVSDKQVAEQKLRDAIREHERTAVGMIAPAAQREAFKSPLEAVIGEYVADLIALGRSEDHVRHVDKRLLRLMRECGWQSLREATPESFLRWRTGQKQAPKTINEYHAALSALFTWLRKQSRAEVNPFEVISKIDTRGKERIRRRALSDAEAQALLSSVPESRRIVYLFALHTGLRRGEIDKLQWDDVKLNGATSSVRVRPEINKNRKDQFLPLHSEMVAVLKDLKPQSVAPNAPVFPSGAPTMKEFRADIKAAGIPWVDERGHRIDFHALRTSYITRLQRSGVSPREAMELARHSDMRLTMKTYTDTAQLPLAATVAQLPSFGFISEQNPHSQIDSQNLGAGSLSVSAAVAKNKTRKTPS
ncbi:MAG TPA: site-specific integrase, partial [Candidatus Saccharimonadales bacterium]|nr:site-specific integrase [Candidatus Saccharimonadales bacterium]